MYCGKLHSGAFTLHPFPKEWFKGIIEYEKPKMVQLDTLDIRSLRWLESSLIDEYIMFEGRVTIYVLHHNIRNDGNKR
jgi:hypothetical protein